MSRNISWMEYLVFIISFGLFISVGGCDKKPTGIDTSGTANFPDIPTNLRVTIGSTQVVLEWDMTNEAGVRIYRIYRAGTPEETFALLDSSTVKRYVDNNVENGKPYYYKVSALNKEGFEGKRSVAISAIPTAYAISIENGAEYIGTRNVVLSITAPPNIQMMMISNDSTFSGAVWATIKPSTNWSLTNGDGEKFVYARFRDAQGIETLRPVHDSIILDTKAVISQVTENSNGQAKKAGDTVHFRVIAGEPGGQATVNITGGPQGLKLFDDGTNGDVLPADGTYELDYLIPDEVDVYLAKVTGHFVDRVQNIADDVVAQTVLTVLRAPDPITLFQPFASGDGQTELKLTWAMSANANDFSNYTIYRNTQPNVSDTTATLVQVINQRTTTEFVDSNLNPNTRYYYKIYVTDITGLRTGSNEVTAITAPKSAPIPVTLYQPLLLADGRVQLTWTKSSDNHFASYRVYRATTASIDTSTDLRAILTSSNETSYFDRDLAEGQNYFFRVFVFDRFGLFTGSNVVSIEIPRNDPPPAVQLSVPAVLDSTKLQLSWSPSSVDDFSHYQLYRSLSSPVDTTSAPIAVISTKRTTDYVDRALTPRTKYYYRIFVVDTGGLQTGSNEVVGQTQ